MNVTLKNTAFLVLLAMLCAGNSFGQDDPALIRQGNKNYEKGKYTDAEKNYLKMVEKNRNSYKGNFNLGDAYYKQGKYKEAISQFEQLAAQKTSKDTLAKAYHNLGNSYIQQYRSLPKQAAGDTTGPDREKILNDGIEAYKKALRNNPNDEDTRYNLAYANRLLKQQQKQNQQNKDKKDKKKDKKDDKNKDKQDKKDDKQDKKNEKQPQLSKEDAKRLLDASNNEEKNTQDKLKKEKVLGKKTQIEKDW